MSLHICIANFLPWERRQGLTLFLVWFMDLSHFTEDWFVCRQGGGARLDIWFELLALVHKWSTTCLQADIEKWENNCVTEELSRCLWGSSVYAKTCTKRLLWSVWTRKGRWSKANFKLHSLKQVEIIDNTKINALHRLSVNIRVLWCW